MKISKKKNININNKQGFTLVELVVVLAGLSALAAFTIPNVLNTIKINRIEEAKALMNSYAADCLGKYRVSTDPVKFVDEAVPDELDNEKLLTLGYQVDKSKCSHTALIPKDEDDNFLYAFDFRISSEGGVLKTATPSNNPRALNSCKGWAGKNCGLSEAQKAEFARLEALAKAKATCISNYQDWLGKKSTGQSKTWDAEKEDCVKIVFAFEGTPVASEEAIKEALDAKYGRACQDWRNTKTKDNNYITKNSSGETKSPECGQGKFWFHSGKEFTNKTDWTEHDNKVKKQTCEANMSKLITQNKSGKQTYLPHPEPKPCGDTVWLCNKVKYQTEADYKTTSCYSPPPPPAPIKPPPPAKCPGTKPKVCKNPWKRWTSPLCTCWNRR